jgi:hypothetical protein
LATGQQVGRLVGEIRDLLDEIVDADVDTFCPYGPISGDELARRLNELTHQLRSFFAHAKPPSWRRDLMGVGDRLLSELDELHDLTGSYYRLGSTWSDVEARFRRFATGLVATGLIEPVVTMDRASDEWTDHGT